mgnify:FL=1
MGLAGGVGAYLSGLVSRKVTPVRILRVAVAGAALSFAPLFFSSSVSQFYMLLAFCGAFHGVGLAMTGSLVALAVSGEEQGVAFGLLQAVQVCGFSISQMIGGVIGATAGLRWVFPVQAAGLLVLLAGIGRLLSRSTDDGL